MKKYESFITTSSEKLSPIIQRLEQLEKSITQLEADISAIIKQKNEQDKPAL